MQGNNTQLNLKKFHIFAIKIHTDLNTVRVFTMSEYKNLIVFTINSGEYFRHICWSIVYKCVYNIICVNTYNVHKSQTYACSGFEVVLSYTFYVSDDCSSLWYCLIFGRDNKWMY